MGVSVYDPLLPDDVLLGTGVVPVSDPFEDADTYDAVVLAVAHDSLRRSANDYLRLLRSDGSPGVIVDVKGVLPAELRADPGVVYWSL